MKPQDDLHSRHAPSILLAGAANVLLGLSSLYWRELDGIQTFIIVAYRILLSTAILTVLIPILKLHHRLSRVTFNIICLHCAASLLIALNWGAFIWSSINGSILESGIGYLLAPFIAIVLGAFIYRETFNTRKIISISIAFGLVALLILTTQHLNHWTYLLISASWGLYTLIKKITPLDAVSGLFIEMLFLATLFALMSFLYDTPIIPTQETSPHSTPLIWLAGGVSIAPLLMFSYATKKLSLSQSGVLQFILPLTLTTIALLRQQDGSPHASLSLPLTTIGMLITLTAYDIIFPPPSKKRKNR